MLRHGVIVMEDGVIEGLDGECALLFGGELGVVLVRFELE